MVLAVVATLPLVLLLLDIEPFLRAIGHIYAGWALSQDFYRGRLHLTALGAPDSYWLDLRGYDPPTTARALKQPLLILQGERDYQVTPDNLAAWRKALAGRPDVTFKTYPKLNHLFMAGEGKSLPAEYEKPGHVEEAVIADIAGWIRK